MTPQVECGWLRRESGSHSHPERQQRGGDGHAAGSGGGEDHSEAAAPERGGGETPGTGDGTRAPGREERERDASRGSTLADSAEAGEAGWGSRGTGTGASTGTSTGTSTGASTLTAPTASSAASSTLAALATAAREAAAATALAALAATASSAAPSAASALAATALAHLGELAEAVVDEGRAGRAAAPSAPAPGTTTFAAAAVGAPGGASTASAAAVTSASTASAAAVASASTASATGSAADAATAATAITVAGSAVPPLEGEVGGVGDEAEDGGVEVSRNLRAGGVTAAVAAALLGWGTFIAEQDGCGVAEAGKAALVHEADLGVRTRGRVNRCGLELLERLSVALACGKVLVKGDRVVYDISLLDFAVRLCTSAGLRRCEALETGGAGDGLGGGASSLSGAPADNTIESWAFHKSWAIQQQRAERCSG